MTNHSAGSAAARAAILLACAGLAAPAALAEGNTLAEGDTPANTPAARSGRLVPLHKAGVLYINMGHRRAVAHALRGHRQAQRRLARPAG